MEIDSYYFSLGNVLYTVQFFLSSGSLLEPPVSGPRRWPRFTMTTDGHCAMGAFHHTTQTVLFSDQTPAVHFLGPRKLEQHLQFAGSFFSAGTADSTSCLSLHYCDELCTPVIHRAGSLESREWRPIKCGHLWHQHQSISCSFALPSSNTVRCFLLAAAVEQQRTVWWRIDSYKASCTEGSNTEPGNKLGTADAVWANTAILMTPQFCPPALWQLSVHSTRVWTSILLKSCHSPLQQTMYCCIYNNIEWMLQGVPYYWGNSTNHRTTSTTVPSDMF